MVPHLKALATSVMNHHNMKSIYGSQSKLWLLAFGPTQPEASYRDKIEKLSVWRWIHEIEFGPHLGCEFIFEDMPERHCPRHVDIVDELWLVRGKVGHKLKYSGDIVHLKQVVIAALLVSIGSVASRLRMTFLIE